MDDRFEAFREMRVRYQLKNILGELGPELSTLQAYFIQECIEEAKQSPEERTVKLIHDVHARFRLKANNDNT